ncbi:MAG: hypothetical protein ACLFV8_06155 [Alphaproteobacteria bacterium]
MTPARPFRAALAALALTAPSAFARSPEGAAGTAVECRLEDAVRRIEVERDPAPERRCEMRYARPEEGRAARVVWFSERDRSFCHARADALIATLARRGWVCDVMPKRNVEDTGRKTVAGPVLTVPRPR